MCKVQLRARAWCKKIDTMLCSLFAFMQCHQYAYNFKYTYFFTWESMNYTMKVVFCSRVELEDHRFNLYTDDCFTTLNLSWLFTTKVLNCWTKVSQCKGVITHESCRYFHSLHNVAIRWFDVSCIPSLPEYQRFMRGWCLALYLDEYPNSNCSAIFKWKDKSDFRGHLEKLCHLVHTYSGIIVISFTYCWTLPADLDQLKAVSGWQQ